jgi:hypothetical protein
MSAAEPAHASGDPTGPGRGAVIHLSSRPGLRRRLEPPVSYDPSPRQTLAEQAEATFTACGRTLTDPDTAAAYQITLNFVSLMLDGAFATDVLGEEAHTSLRGMVRNMADAPHLLL